jgi:hypothetical protein
MGRLVNIKYDIETVGVYYLKISAEAIRDDLSDAYQEVFETVGT